MAIPIWKWGMFASRADCTRTDLVCCWQVDALWRIWLHLLLALLLLHALQPFPPPDDVGFHLTDNHGRCLQIIRTESFLGGKNGQMISEVKWGGSLDENIADRHKVITDDNGRQTLQTMRDRCIIKSSPPVSHMTTWHCVLQLPLGWEVVQKTLQKFAGSANLPRYMQFILDFHKWWTFTKNGWLDIFSTHCWVVQLKWSCQIVFICCELFG